MSTEDNIAAYRRVTAAFATGDLTVVDELVAPEMVEHQIGSLGNGSEALKQMITYLRSSMPDLEVTIDDLVAVGDEVWSRGKFRGTFSGELMGRTFHDEPISLDAVDIVRFRDGRVVEHWAVVDRLQQLEQLGVVPQTQPEQRAA